MPSINFTVLPEHAVSMAIVTEKTEGRITAIKVWLRLLQSVTEPTEFILNNNLKPLIMAEAGIVNDSDDYFNLLTDVDDYTSGSYYIYEVRLSHTENT